MSFSNPQQGSARTFLAMTCPGGSESLDGMLPGLLLGARVVMGDTPGVIMGTGHWYGPGSGHDQARVKFDPVWHPGDPDHWHPCRRRGRWHEEETIHYLSNLSFASDHFQP